MIFLKWEEPVEPNGLITQYEVSLCVCVFSGILITVGWCQRQVVKSFKFIKWLLSPLLVENNNNLDPSGSSIKNVLQEI